MEQLNNLILPFDDKEKKNGNQMVSISELQNKFTKRFTWLQKWKRSNICVNKCIKHHKLRTKLQSAQQNLPKGNSNDRTEKKHCLNIQDVKHTVKQKWEEN